MNGEKLGVGGKAGGMMHTRAHTCQMLDVAKAGEKGTGATSSNFSGFPPVIQFLFSQVFLEGYERREKSWFFMHFLPTYPNPFSLEVS